jgi:hypothetical protein
VKLWLGVADTGVAVAGNPALSADGKTVTYTPVQRPAFGQTYTLVAKVKDSIGRSVESSVPFTTAAMVCVDSAVWSNPANFSSAYQNCVAPIGVQVKIDQAYNKMQDDTCTMALDSPLSAACQAYLANETIMLANTSIAANSHLVTWAAYVGTDGKSNLVLLDTNDPANPTPAPVASLALPSPLAWLIGNTTGASVRTADGKTSRASLDATNHIVLTCLVGC